MARKKKDPDGTGNGGAGGNVDGTLDPPDPTGGQRDGAGDPPTPPNKGDLGDSDTVKFSAEQQAHLDTIIAGRLTRAKSSWEKWQQAAAARVEQEAERTRLKDQEKFKELAGQLESRVAELEPLEDQVTAYQTAVAEILQAELGELGEKATTAVDKLPGEPDALAKLQWLRANRDLFVDAGTAGGGTPRPRKKGQLPGSQRPAVPKPRIRA